MIEFITTWLNIEIEIIPTRDWAESLVCSKAGECMILLFLNQTPERGEIINRHVFILVEELADDTLFCRVGGGGSHRHSTTAFLELPAAAV